MMADANRASSANVSASSSRDVVALVPAEMGEEEYAEEDAGAETGDMRDAIDCVMSESRTDARFWFFVNLPHHRVQREWVSSSVYIRGVPLQLLPCLGSRVDEGCDWLYGGERPEAGDGRRWW